MAHYIQFDAGETDGAVILIEVDSDEIDPNEEGIVKVGFKGVVEGTVALAKKPFTTAIRSAIKYNVQGLMEAIQSLSDPPTEVEITFGLKATGEVGNVAVGKAGAETNYTVKLVWKQISNGD